jgi:hypothetical protein
MTAVLLAILAITVIGLPLTIAVDRTARGARLLGLAFLYGSAAVMYALMLLSLVRIPWTALAAGTTLIVFASIAWLVVRWQRRRALNPQEAPLPLTQRPHLFDVITLLLLGAYGAYITVASPWEWDYWAIWGLKARVFFEHGGIDWSWLGNRWNEFAHPDYPLLVPFNYDFACLLNGAWDDRWFGLLLIAWALAALLIVRSLAADEAKPWAAAAATAASAILAMSNYAGMAEGALIAFAATGLLYQRRALDDARARPADQWHAAILLGLAANCKNEGIALLAATAIATVAADPRRWRRVLALWPAAALLAPWMLLRATHALPTDLASGDLLARFADRVAHAGALFTVLRHALVDGWSWLVLIAGFAIVPRAVRRERFIVTVTFVQLAFFVATYFVTPHDFTWHIMTSWQRLTRQVQIPITVVCVLLLAQFVVRGEDARHAEARPDQL